MGPTSQGNGECTVKVSVVIPAYNAEKYLMECLDSIRQQTKPFSQVVVVNDCSTDSTLAIAKDNIAAPVSKIVTTRTNLGIGNARKQGSMEANGDYICFLSHDDVYLPTYLETMLEYVDGESILYSDYVYCDHRLEPLSVFSSPRWNTQEEFRRLAIEWALQRIMFTNFSSVMIPRAVFSKVQFNESLRFGEDSVFLLETIRAKIPWKHVPEVLVYYRVHSEAGTQKMWKRSDWENWWHKLGIVLRDLGVSEKRINNAMHSSFHDRFGWRRRMKAQIPIQIKPTLRHIKHLLTEG